ncbi:MAG: IspD/TarI family cytidylyltransferase [Gammaproteobacteria bacterium]
MPQNPPSSKAANTHSAVRPVLIVPAAGQGARFGTSVAKQWHMVAGRSLLEWSLRAITDVLSCIKVVIALHEADFRTRAPMLRSIFPEHLLLVCTGGASRAASVMNCLRSLRESEGTDVDDMQWVMVHDAVRPLAPQADVLKLVAAVDRMPEDLWHGALLAEPVAASIKKSSGWLRAEEPVIASEVDRTDLWLAQTPQLFRLGALWNSLQQQSDHLIQDESQAVRSCGGAVRLVAGSSLNFKVTWPQDLDWVSTLLTHRRNATPAVSPLLPT